MAGSLSLLPLNLAQLRWGLRADKGFGTAPPGLSWPHSHTALLVAKFSQGATVAFERQIRLTPFGLQVLALCTLGVNTAQ